MPSSFSSSKPDASSYPFSLPGLLPFFCIPSTVRCSFRSTTSAFQLISFPKISYPITPFSSRSSSPASSILHAHGHTHTHKFPPANALYQLVGKSNFQLWLSAIKPYLFSNIESTGLILGGWTEPKPGPTSRSQPTTPSTNERSTTSTSEHWDRERWTAANTETCRFIRGTLAINVLPHVRQHHTAKALWHNLLWLYGEQAGIDTQGGPPVTVSGPFGSANSNGNGNLVARNGQGGSDGRATLLPALAVRNSASVDFDLDVNIATPISSTSGTKLPPVTKAFGEASSSRPYGTFLEVRPLDGLEERNEQDAFEEGEDIEDHIVDTPSKIPVSSKAAIPTPVIVTITDSMTLSRMGKSQGKETSTPLVQTNSQQLPPRLPTSVPHVKDNATTNLWTVHEDEEVVHPGRRVDLSDSSVLIRRHHHHCSVSILHRPVPSRERGVTKKDEDEDEEKKTDFITDGPRGNAKIAKKRLAAAVGGFKRIFIVDSPGSSTDE
ncbi:uncharacterized protein A1O9_05566 [Exophiala aquamarina CBS 119918]|uniref:Uncharacterized protein n=1 Tax=Exophiala aquamarina CBS 119918 TaxID=1182545 RepID=A0A072PED2_9EURO|nr:uncharacterized protein A1O9_05566 [Exophiala aquamarina CBS 119918]KEF57648.1 hypothetical protein A1O9_05566 [Exophiala aquamarina CBS 119918]